MAANIIRYVIAILASLKVHPIYSKVQFPNSRPLQDVRQSLDDNSTHSSFVAFWAWVSSELWTIITSADKRVLGAQSYDLIFSKFHILRVGSVLQRWTTLLKDIGVSSTTTVVSNVVLQFLLRNLLETIIKERNSADKPSVNNLKSATLTTHDHQVINYICGFIPFALIKRFSKVKSATAASFVRLLKSWKLNESTQESTENSFQAYAREWLVKQSRGYLFQPNWDLHCFFRTLEYVGRKYLCKNAIGQYKDTNLQRLLLDEFESNTTVKHRWCALLKGQLDPSESEQLFSIMSKYWIKIRCTAYVKVYIDIRKANDKNVSRKAEKGLRKNLDKH